MTRKERILEIMGFLAVLGTILMAALGMFAVARGADPKPGDAPAEKPTPAKDRFVEVISQNPLKFNADFVRFLDGDTSLTVAQRYAAVKSLIFSEEGAGARNIGGAFDDATPAQRARLKAVTAAAFQTAKAQAAQVVSALDTKTSEALSAE